MCSGLDGERGGGGGVGVGGGGGGGKEAVEKSGWLGGWGILCERGHSSMVGVCD